MTSAPVERMLCWMYADQHTSVSNPIAWMNPERWSRVKSFEATVADIMAANPEFKRTVEVIEYEGSTEKCRYKIDSLDDFEAQHGSKAKLRTQTSMNEESSQNTDQFSSSKSLQGGPTSIAKWVPIKRGDAIPRDAVVVGSIPTEGVVWVGRASGEPGKINASDRKMNSFCGRDIGTKTEAEILCCPAENVKWLPSQKGQAIPSNAMKAGATPSDGPTYVARYEQEPGKINVQDGAYWNFWGAKCGRKVDAEILVIVDEADSGDADRARSRGLSFEPPGRGRQGPEACDFMQCEAFASKSPDEQKADALRRLSRLVLHGDVDGVERMLPRARQLAELASDADIALAELQKIEASLQALKAEGEFVLLRGG